MYYKGLFEVYEVEVGGNLGVLVEVGDNDELGAGRGRIDKAGIKGTGIDGGAVEAVVFKESDFIGLGED